MNQLTKLIFPLFFQPPVSSTPDGTPIFVITPSMEESIKQITKPIKWLDDRIYCKHARAEDAAAAAACPERRAGNSGPYCGLCGQARQLRCAFDEPENSDLWQRIRASVAEYRRKGWTK
jgi:hypothetical protein